jgi:vacuolar-type H+-ATPase subunit C/Vma6
MVARIPGDLLPRGPLPELRTIADLERVLWERALQRANTQFYQSVGDLGAAVAFYAIKRVELANLFRVIEGVRYGMEPDAIRQGLIRPHPPARVR